MGEKNNVEIKSIKSKIDELTKEFEVKAKELEDKTSEFNKFKATRLEELVRIQGAYRALDSIIHAH